MWHSSDGGERQKERETAKANTSALGDSRVEGEGKGGPEGCGGEKMRLLLIFSSERGEVNSSIRFIQIHTNNDVILNAISSRTCSMGIHTIIGFAAEVGGERARVDPDEDSGTASTTSRPSINCDHSIVVSEFPSLRSQSTGESNQNISSPRIPADSKSDRLHRQRL